VLKAMGLSDANSASLVRLSLGRESTEQEISELESALPKVVQQIWDAA
jgi:cysteine sulfinate desulfinase/cysteine desulfurase-like protein